MRSARNCSRFNITQAKSFPTQLKGAIALLLLVLYRVSILKLRVSQLKATWIWAYMNITTRTGIQSLSLSVYSFPPDIHYNTCLSTSICLNSGSCRKVHQCKYFTLYLTLNPQFVILILY